MKKIRQYLFPALSFALSLVSALFWVALRINHSGISKFLGADTNQSFLIMNLPVMVCAAAWLGVILAFAGLLWRRKKWLSVTGFAVGAAMAAAAVIVIQFGARDYLRFILPHFWKSLAAAALIAAFGLILFFPVANKNRSILAAKAVLLAAVILAAVVLGYGLRPCDFTYGAVVYAVEDDYQIVFSTSDSAVCWVEIGGDSYYDLYAGSMRSADRVHKVTVPQSVLDDAGSYTVCAKQMIYRGPFGGYTGETISRNYDFRPVDASDGLDYFALSDVHEAVSAATAAATTRDNLDFLVLLGDLVSMVETEKDAQLANELAYGITGGEIPVIYARGNHEIKGEYGEVLYKYVGSKHQEFSYWVTLGSDVFAVVLDMGEDHEDDWWEYYGTARFDLYRQAQTEMLEQILEERNYVNYPYRMALCHIPIPYVDEDGRFDTFRREWTDLLNELGTDISLSGHEHKLWPLIPGAVEPFGKLTYTAAFAGASGKSPGGYVTDHTFPTFLVGRRSLTQTGGTQSNGYDQYMGMAFHVNLEDGIQSGWYVNSNRETVPGFYPFEGAYSEEQFTEIHLELN